MDQVELDNFIITHNFESFEPTNHQILYRQFKIHMTWNPRQHVACFFWAQKMIQFKA